MRKKSFRTLFAGLCFALLVPLSVFADIEINEQNFPDANFRNWLQSQSYGKDGVITDDEFSLIRSINVNNEYLVNLEGIQYFTALTELRCSNNQLTTLDVSKNTALKTLDCSVNRLTTLDLPKSTALTTLSCGSNMLTALDVSGCTALTTLDCEYNQLTALDVFGCTALIELSCGSNMLTALDVSGCTALIELSCGGNNLTSLDVSKNTELTEFICGYNQLTSLDVSGCTALEWLDCDNNQLTELEITNNTTLRTLHCSYNSMTTLNLSGCTSLKKMYSSDNPLVTVNLSGCTALENLVSPDIMESEYRVGWYPSNPELKTLNLSGCTSLEWLECYSDQLTSLDVSGCTSLNLLVCNGTQLTTLDASDLALLVEVQCINNKLTTLNLAGCINLEYLYCSNNQLATLNLSDCRRLTEVNCTNNNIYGENMDKLIESLPNLSGYIEIYDSRNRDNNICTWNQVNALRAKGWTVCEDDYQHKYGGMVGWSIDMHAGQGEAWATLYAPFGYTLPEGTEAYTGVLNAEGNALVLTSIGQKVPKGTPVLLKGDNISITLDIDDNITAEVGKNDLTGQYEAYTEPTDEVYALGMSNKVVGFYKYDDIIGKFKAVLRLPEGIAANGYKLMFGDDELTAIEDANAIVDNANAVYYDLQGRRVAEPQRGQLYIVNGKTIVYQP